MSVQLVVRFLHVVAAITWIGGMLFIALVLVPVTRGVADPALRRTLVQAAGRRFRTVGWIALAALVASGLVNLMLRPELLGAPRFWVKAVLVLVALGLSALHDFVLGPRAGRPDLYPSARAHASWLARGEVVLVLVIVALGLALRG